MQQGEGQVQVVVWQQWHKVVLRRYKESWFDRHFRFSLPLGVLALAGALMVNFWTIHQATSRAGEAVPDIILSNIPVFKVDELFVYGTFVVIIISLLILIPHPKRFPFALHTVTLFILIRSAFTLMTHLGAPEASYSTDFGETIMRSFYGADQFFSAHTGMPFLGALAFWKVNNKLALFFLTASLFFGAIVLLGHIHYTIDVMSAFFITYGIFHIALWLFPKERLLFLADR